MQASQEIKAHGMAVDEKRDTILKKRILALWTDSYYNKFMVLDIRFDPSVKGYPVYIHYKYREWECEDPRQRLPAGRKL